MADAVNLFFTSVLLIAIVGCRVQSSPIEKFEDALQKVQSSDTNVAILKVIEKTFNKCRHSENFLNCLKGRSLVLLEQINQEPGVIPIFGQSVTLVNEGATVRDGRAHPVASEEELEKSLPRDYGKLDELLAEGFLKFFKNYSLRFKVNGAAINDVENSVGEARRRRRNRLGSLIMMALMMKATLGAVAMKGVAALAGKALLVATMALVLSSIVGLKKLLSNSGHEEKVEVINVPASNHGWGRSENVKDAHEMAYNAYAH